MNDRTPASSSPLLPLLLLMAAIPLASGCSSSNPAPAPDRDTDSEHGGNDKDQRDRALLNAIQAPQDKARAVEAQVLDAAKKQQEQIDAQSGD